MFGKGMNKKAQEGLTLTTLLLIVLGAVVVVVIILGVTGGFDFIFGKIDLLPGQNLEAVVQSCQIAAQQSLIADYCLTFKQVDIDGVKQYVNCQDPRVQIAFSKDISDKPNCPEGNYTSFEVSAETYCLYLNQTKTNLNAEKTLVNGLKCSELFAR